MNHRKILNLGSIVLLPGFLLGFRASAAFAEEAKASAQTIIGRSDAVRNPAKPFSMNIRLTEYVKGAVRNEIALRGFAKDDGAGGQFKNLVRYMEPPRDAGKAVLMNGTVMWFYDPASKSSVRISAQQRLLGQASEGDVITVNFAQDYKAKVVGPNEGESLDDADHKARKCWHLDMAPAHDSAVYGRIEYWVEKGTFRPVKGKFYSDSGRLLKIAYYHKFEQALGAERPMETIIIDAVDSKLVTTINTSGYQFKDIPDSWYQRDYLPRLKVD